MKMSFYNPGIKKLGNKISPISAIFLILIFLLPVIASAETLYAKTSRVKIRYFASMWAEAKATLKKNDSFEVISKKGNFYEGKTADGNIGWIFRFDLTPSKSLKQNVESDVLADLGENKPVFVDEATTSSSIRGVVPESENKPEEMQDTTKYNEEKFEISDDGFLVTSPWY
jgi:hypothetical protein